MPRLFTEKKLVIATHNKGKLAEFRALLSPLGIEVTSAGELGLPDPEETGTSFAENALIKARAACDASGLPALGDDSGLCVAALGGAPGIHSARWCGDARDPAVGVARIQEELCLLPREGGEEKKWDASLRWHDNDFDDSLSLKEQLSPQRRLGSHLVLGHGEEASFFCSLALVWPDGAVEAVEGECKGRLVFPPRGDLGHGYDPWFQPDGEVRTFGEMEQNEKEALSHRGVAMRKLLALFVRP